MLCITRTILSSTAFVFLAQHAVAELAAKDVWNDWKAYVSGFGYTITGQEEPTSSGLSISGVTMSAQAADTYSGTKISMDRIVMTEQPDGTVQISLPSVMPIEMSTANETGGQTRVSLDYRHSNLDLVAGGTSSNLNYTYEANEITLTTTGFEVNGTALPDGENILNVIFDTVSGTSTTVIDTQRRYQQDLSVGTLKYNFAAKDSTVQSSSQISGQTQDVSFSGQTAVPLRQIETDDMDALLAAGLNTDGVFSYLANATTFSVAAATGQSEASLISGAGTFSVQMDRDGLTYDGQQNDLQLEVQSAQFPLPLSFEMAKAAFNISAPVRQSEAPDDFALGLSLDGFTMSDMLWGLFDPGAQLPRDPATVAIDLSGKVALLMNFLDPTSVTNLTPGQIPTQIESLDINRVQVSAVGAEITGKGAFSFETDPLGVPKPEGAVDLKLVGGNGLIDKLVATGLLQDQEAMGARMMMGLLAVPGDAPDTLTSKIEINNLGHVLANGQRIQ